MGIPVPGYENYIIYEDSRIFSNYSKKFLVHSIAQNGYHTVQLFKNKKGKRMLVHRLVAEAFIPNPDNLPQVNHKDENKDNNCANNLEWCTAKYNMNYGNMAKNRHKLIDYSKEIYKKIARENGKKVSKKVIQIKNEKIINIFESAAEASRKTGANHSHIIECCNGKRYRTVNGFVWKFVKGGDDLLASQF